MPDIGEMSEAETFLNFFFCTQKCPLLQQAATTEKSKSTILTDTLEKNKIAVAPPNNFGFKTWEILILQK